MGGANVPGAVGLAEAADVGAGFQLAGRVGRRGVPVAAGAGIELGEGGAMSAGFMTCCADTGTPSTYRTSCPEARSRTSCSVVGFAEVSSFDAADVADQPRAAVMPNTVVEVRPVARILPITARR